MTQHPPSARGESGADFEAAPDRDDAAYGSYESYEADRMQEYSVHPDPLADGPVTFDDRYGLPHALTGAVVESDEPAQSAGPPLPESAWAPPARTPTPVATPKRRRGKVVGTIIIVWVCLGVVNGVVRSQFTSSSGGSSVGAGVETPAPQLPARLVPADTPVKALPKTVTSFRVEVESDDPSVRLLTVRSADDEGVVRPFITPPWQGRILPQQGFTPQSGPERGQTFSGREPGLVSAVLTARTSAASSRVQCRVYADAVLITVVTGTGSLWCPIPASPR